MATHATAPTLIRILLAEKRALLRIGVRESIKQASDMVVLGEASNCAEAVARIERLTPDLVVVGSLADCAEPIEAARLMATGCSAYTPRFLTLADVRDMRAGVSVQDGMSTLLIDTSPDQLVSAVRMLTAGYTFFHATGAEPLPRRNGQLRPADLRSVTQRELEVVHLLARGCTNREIARRLALGETTVKTHVRSVLHKLSLRSRVDAVIFAYENGLIKVGDGRADASD